MEKQIELNLKEEITSKIKLGSNFLEYFFTVGLNETDVGNPFLFCGTVEELNKSFSPSISNKFPPFNKPEMEINDALKNVFE